MYIGVKCVVPLMGFIKVPWVMPYVDRCSEDNMEKIVVGLGVV